jgi:hypothetical protein
MAAWRFPWRCRPRREGRSGGAERAGGAPPAPPLLPSPGQEPARPSSLRGCRSRSRPRGFPPGRRRPLFPGGPGRPYPVSAETSAGDGRPNFQRYRFPRRPRRRKWSAGPAGEAAGRPFRRSGRRTPPSPSAGWRLVACPYTTLTTHNNLIGLKCLKFNFRQDMTGAPETP